MGGRFGAEDWDGTEDWEGGSGQAVGRRVWDKRLGGRFGPGHKIQREVCLGHRGLRGRLGTGDWEGGLGQRIWREVWFVWDKRLGGRFGTGGLEGGLEQAIGREVLGGKRLGKRFWTGGWEGGLGQATGSEVRDRRLGGRFGGREGSFAAGDCEGCLGHRG